MHRFGGWITAALLAACALEARAADPAAPAGPALVPATPWYKRWFGLGSTPPPPEPAKPARKLKPSEIAAQTLDEEQEIYLKRLAVCDRFRQIGVETGNEQLLREAEEMERLAAQLYQRRVAHLPHIRDGKSPDAAALDRRLGTGVAASPLDGARPKPGIDRTSRAANREDKP